MINKPNVPEVCRYSQAMGRPIAGIPSSAVSEMHGTRLSADHDCQYALFHRCTAPRFTMQIRFVGGAELDMLDGIYAYRARSEAQAPNLKMPSLAQVEICSEHSTVEYARQHVPPPLPCRTSLLYTARCCLALGSCCVQLPLPQRRARKHLQRLSMRRKRNRKRLLRRQRRLPIER